MTLPATFYLTQHHGCQRWLDAVSASGYVLGVDLVEGEYLVGVSDAGNTAERFLLAAETAGLIRRGELRPSFSQRAWAGLGNMATVSKGSEPPTWFAWHPGDPNWRHPALTGGPVSHDYCSRCDDVYPRQCAWHALEQEERT